MLHRVRFESRLLADRISGLLLGVPLTCEPRGTVASVAARSSPPAELRFKVGSRRALVCYSRPLTRGRKIFGDFIPWGELWRVGANEPTTLHLPFSAQVAGKRVWRGRMSLYAIPRPDRWTLILNRSTRQWGITRTETGSKGRVFQSAYTRAVRRAELGRIEIEPETIPHVEQLTITAEPDGDSSTSLLIDWETTRLRVPITV